MYAGQKQLSSTEQQLRELILIYNRCPINLGVCVTMFHWLWNIGKISHRGLVGGGGHHPYSGLVPVRSIILCCGM